MAHSDTSFAAARLSRPPSEQLRRHYQLPGLERERRQFAEFSQIDLAHTVMLVEQGIVPRDTGRQILSALIEIRDAGPDALAIDAGKGSLLFQIEAALAGRIGEDAAGAVHTARSRIDQSATAKRLYKRAGLLRVMERVLSLEHVVLEAAQRHADVLMPSYTHMQQAQPGNFGHYLLAFATRLQLDFQRCTEVFARVNLSPLGTVGLSGTGWPIDRHRTADLLGFEGLVYNAKLGREAYYAAEIAASLSLVMSDLNDLATDLHVWSSQEFGLVELDDAYCSSSSIFPQKKNPVTLETIKAAAGPAVTWFAAALATFRGEGTGDQAIRSVGLLDGALATTADMLELAAGILDGLQVHERRMGELLAGSWSTSSNLADVLVRDHGLSFRQAHHVVARLVRICLHDAVPRAQVTQAHLQQAARETLGAELAVGTDALQAALDPREFVRTRISAGSVGPTEVAYMLDTGRDAHRCHLTWLRHKQRHLADAAASLDLAVNTLLTG